MIDTVVLVLKENTFFMHNKDMFKRNSTESGSGYFRKYIMNPSKSEIAQYGYLPRLTYIERYRKAWESELRIECSIPKLIHSNNFVEITDDNFSNVVDALVGKVHNMGTDTFEDSVADSTVSTIHYSKNFILTDGSTPKMYLDLFHKANISLRYDTNQTDYRNEGHSFKYHTNTFEVALYDKLQDLQRAKISEKRAEEKDSYIQMDLFGAIEKSKREAKKPFEVLRLEARLNNKRKIKKVLQKFNIPEDLRFCKLFSSKTSQVILTYYLNDLIDSVPKVAYGQEDNPEQFLASFRIDNPKTTLNEIVSAYGYSQLAQKIGVRGLKASISNGYKDKWYRFNSKMKGYNYPTGRYNPMQELSKQLAEFAPVRSIDFPELMLNNDKYD